MLKVHNKFYNTYPLIVHHPYLDSEISPFWNALLADYKTLKVVVPDDLTIITWNNKPRKGHLEVQLDYLNVPYKCLGKGLSWKTNRLKTTTLLAEIDNIKTKYILGMDCFDVILVDTLEDIIDRFKKKDSKLIYNAASWLYPSVESHRKIENDLCPNPPFQFLNGGLFIGEKEHIKNVLSNASNESKFPNSEQYVLKMIYHKNPELISLDWRCEIFQIIHLPKNFKINIEDYVECR